jgi:exodeoxyribonuclease V alpha subunit
MTALQGHEARLALRATGLLAAYNRAGILTASDVHVAQRLGRLGGESDDAVLLAVALVVRSTRHGSVVLDLATAEASTRTARRAWRRSSWSGRPTGSRGAPPAPWSADRCG